VDGGLVEVELLANVGHPVDEVAAVGEVGGGGVVGGCGNIFRLYKLH